MHILIVSTMAESPWGGSEELWAQMADCALRAGHQVSALLPRWQPRHTKVQALEQSGLRVLEWQDLNCHTTGNTQQNRPMWYPYHSIPEIRPDMICISNGGFMDVVNGHQLLIALLLQIKIPYNVIVQANTDLYFPNDQQRDVLRVYYGQAQRVFFVSPANLRIAERQLAVSLPNAELINNPVNIQDFSPLPWCHSQKAKIACVARFDTWAKGQDLLFEVLSQNRWQTRDWSLELFGKGVHERYLRELVQHFGLSEKVSFAGTCLDIRQLWFNQQLLVLPSRLEGTPLVLFEAMLCGRPAVVTEVGGNADWVQDGESGFIAQAACPHLLDHAMEAAWANRSQWQVMGEKAREIFLTRHEQTPGKTLLNRIIDQAVTWHAPSEAVSTPTNLNSKPQVSVIITCDNNGHYLAEAVVSVINQTYRSHEIIIVNNGGTDNSNQIAQKLMAQYPQQKIRLINQKDASQPAVAKNNGIAQAQGELIMCLDAADMIASTMLEMCVSALNANPSASIAYTDAIYFSEDNTTRRVDSGRFDLVRLATANQVFSCVLCHKDVWKKVGGYKLNCRGYEDWDFWIASAEQGISAVKVPEALFFSRNTDDEPFADNPEKEEQSMAAIVSNHSLLYDEATKQWASAILERSKAVHVVTETSSPKKVDLGAQCPLTGKEGVVLSERQPTELVAAYGNYLGAPLPEWICKKYFREPVTEYQCLESGLRWYSPGIVGENDYYETLGKIYPWYYRDEAWDKDVICEILKKRGCTKFVEFGCGNGAFLSLCRQNGIKGWGVDINRSAIKNCRELGFEVFDFNSLPSSPPQSDTLCLLQTIEHVPDPVDFLGKIINKIDCQTVILSAPSHEALLGYTRDPLSWPPHHFTAWSELAFSTLAERVGFTLSLCVSEPLTLERLEGMLRMEKSRELRNLPPIPEGSDCAVFLSQMQERGLKWALYSHSIVAVLQKIV